MIVTVLPRNSCANAAESRTHQKNISAMVFFICPPVRAHPDSMVRLSSPRLGSAALHPPVQPRLDAKFIAFAVLLREVVAFFCKRDVDDSLSTLVFVKNNLFVVSSTRRLACQHIGNFHDLIPGDDAALHRPVN